MSSKIFRPGGFDLTLELTRAASLAPGSKLLDVGCGSGATVSYLRDCHGLDAAGIDPAWNDGAGNGAFFACCRGDAYDLPIPDGSLDAVLCECSFSLVNNPRRALREFYRALRPRGWLLFSDLYSRTGPAQLSGPAKYLYTLPQVRRMMGENHFVISLLEDRNEALKAMLGQMILDSGRDSLYSGLGVSYEDMKRIRCSYYLLAAYKEEAPL